MIGVKRLREIGAYLSFEMMKRKCSWSKHVDLFADLSMRATRDRQAWGWLGKERGGEGEGELKVKMKVMVKSEVGS